MAAKTLECPACRCLNVLPATDAEGANVKCVACGFIVHVDAKGGLKHLPLAPEHKTI